MRSYTELAQALVSSHNGLSMREMTEKSRKARQTIYRWFDEISIQFPQYELSKSKHDDGVLRWKLAPTDYEREGSGKRFLSRFTPEDLAELEDVIKYTESRNLEAKYTHLEDIFEKMHQMLSSKDVEALEEMKSSSRSTVALSPKPRFGIRTDKPVISEIQTGILERKRVKIVYDRYGDKTYEVSPYGFLIYEHPYFVATVGGESSENVRLFRLANVVSVEKLGAEFIPIPEFDVQDYAKTALGPYHGKQLPVRLRFSQSVSREITSYEFHPNEERLEMADGSTEISFTASGEKEICNHLFVWSDAVEIVEPEELKSFYVDDLNSILRQYSK